MADLLEQDQKFAAQYYNYESGAISRLYGFEVYEFDECPYFNTTTKKKLAYGAVPTTQENLFSMRTYTLCLPTKAEGLGAIVSAPKPAGGNG